MLDTNILNDRQRGGSKPGPLLDRAAPEIKRNGDRPRGFIHMPANPRSRRRAWRQKGSVLGDEQIGEFLVIDIARLERRILQDIFGSLPVQTHDIDTAYEKLLAFVDIDCQ